MFSFSNRVKKSKSSTNDTAFWSLKKYWQYKKWRYNQLITCHRCASGLVVLPSRPARDDGPVVAMATHAHHQVAAVPGGESPGTALRACQDTADVDTRWHQTTTDSPASQWVRGHFVMSSGDIWCCRCIVTLKFFRRYKCSDWRFCVCAIYVNSLMCSERTMHLLCINTTGCSLGCI